VPCFKKFKKKWIPCQRVLEKRGKVSILEVVLGTDLKFFYLDLIIPEGTVQIFVIPGSISSKEGSRQTIGFIKQTISPEMICFKILGKLLLLT
jgi:uncharacterized metal-binding protein